MATIGATANLFLSVSKPPPQNLSVPLQQGTFLLNKPVLVFKKVPFSSSSLNPVIVDEEEEEEELNDSESVLSSTRGCKACGRDELEKGCNGEGRIQGGIATVPGFGWWPIKAYRPCPGFVASGGRYRRRGQSMDEVASGQGKKPNRVVPQQTNDETLPSKKKKQGPRKFKR